MFEESPDVSLSGAGDGWYVAYLFCKTLLNDLKQMDYAPLLLLLDFVPSSSAKF